MPSRGLKAAKLEKYVATKEEMDSLYEVNLKKVRSVRSRKKSHTNKCTGGAAGCGLKAARTILTACR